MHAKKLFLILVVLAITGILLLNLWLLAGYRITRQEITYLPDISVYNSGIIQNHEKTVTYTIKSQYYTLEVNSSGKVTVKTPDNEVIISDLTFFSDYEGLQASSGLRDIEVRKENDSTITIQGEGASETIVNIVLKTSRYLPEFEISFSTEYYSDVIVKREALVAAFAVPVSEVYRKNRKADNEKFEAEYWLDKQGVRFGYGSRSALIYHNTAISSLQLNTTNNILFINLDFFEDHPYIHIPFQADGGGRWIDLSPSKYSSNDRRINSVKFYIGSTPEYIPRFMLVPSGFLAGHIFTEHADGGERIESHYAVYYGSDTIKDIRFASGGFVGHNIPVTKSVMYIDYNGKLSDKKTEPVSGRNMMTEFLDQLHLTGKYDICLHTPEEHNSDRATLEEAISYMKDRYDTRSWIDHGMYSGKYNRECFVCDGLSPESEYYAGDLWHEFDTRYFWNTAVEMKHLMKHPSAKNELKKFRFRNASKVLWNNHLSAYRLNSINYFQALRELVTHKISNERELNSLMPGKGESSPTPLYWQHPTYTQGLYSWVTNYAKDYFKLSLKDADKHLENEKRQIDELISNWGIFLNHGYYVRGLDVITEQNGRLEINPYFDQILAYMEDNQNKRGLYNTTVKELLDYWRLIENVSYSCNSDGTIKLCNRNDFPVNGLSLAVRANKVMIDGVVPSCRRVEKDIIFWFDLAARSSAIIECE